MGKFRTRAASVVAALAVAGSVAVSSELPASAATGCSATFTTYRTISRGSTGAQARAAECLLSKAGYRTTVNGSISRADAVQLARFRGSVGLSAIQVAGPRGWVALLSHGTRPTLHRGSTGASVVRLQRALRAARFNVAITGRFDFRTVSAVQSIQRARHLVRSGTVTSSVWRALQAGRVLAPKAPVVHTSSRPATSSRGARALAFAKQQLGEPYRYGAAGPNAWDCSGLTMKAWQAAGVSLPHNAAAQFRRGRSVSKSNLQPGDLVFFYSGPGHVAIYAGHGMVIHASRPGQPVAYIKMSYMPFTGARRP